MLALELAAVARNRDRRVAATPPAVSDHARQVERESGSEMGSRGLPGGLKEGPVSGRNDLVHHGLFLDRDASCRIN